MRNCTVRSLAITLLLAAVSGASAQNQTPDVSPIQPETTLPIRIGIEQAGFSLPSGVQSYVAATLGGRWLILAGRSNGLHGFGSNDFPPNEQNTTVIVVDPVQQTVVSRSLIGPGAGLTQAQVDLLSVTSAQAYQAGNTLYMTGGYGVDTATGTFTTKDALTAIDVPGLMQWVAAGTPAETAAQHIRQIHDPVFQVTGGVMTPGAGGVTLLIFGQDFVGDNVFVNGTYTQQVRRFRIQDDGVNLAVTTLPPLPASPDPNDRRRDLNVVPIVRNGFEAGWAALSGVFTPGNGVWTVPVDIATDGTPSMADPAERIDVQAGHEQLRRRACRPVFAVDATDVHAAARRHQLRQLRRRCIHDRCAAAVRQPGDDDRARTRWLGLAVPDEHRISHHRVERLQSGQHAAVRRGRAVLQPPPGCRPIRTVSSTSIRSAARRRA